MDVGKRQSNFCFHWYEENTSELMEIFEIPNIFQGLIETSNVL